MQKLQAVEDAMQAKRLKDLNDNARDARNAVKKIREEMEQEFRVGDVGSFETDQGREEQKLRLKAKELQLFADSEAEKERIAYDTEVAIFEMRKSFLQAMIDVLANKETESNDLAEEAESLEEGAKYRAEKRAYHDEQAKYQEELLQLELGYETIKTDHKLAEIERRVQAEIQALEFVSTAFQSIQATMWNMEMTGAKRREKLAQDLMKSLVKSELDAMGRIIKKKIENAITSKLLAAEDAATTVTTEEIKKAAKESTLAVTILETFWTLASGAAKWVAGNPFLAIGIIAGLMTTLMAISKKARKMVGMSRGGVAGKDQTGYIEPEADEEVFAPTKTLEAYLAGLTEVTMNMVSASMEQLVARVNERQVQIAVIEKEAQQQIIYNNQVYRQESEGQSPAANVEESRQGYYTAKFYY